MSLENLLAINRLARHEASAAAAVKLLAAAQRNLADSRAINITAENRFHAAYNNATSRTTRATR